MSNINIKNAIDDLLALTDISKNLVINSDKMEISEIVANSVTVTKIAQRVIELLEKQK